MYRAVGARRAATLVACGTAALSCSCAAAVHDGCRVMGTERPALLRGRHPRSTLHSPARWLHASAVALDAAAAPPGSLGPRTHAALRRRRVTKALPTRLQVAGEATQTSPTAHTIATTATTAAAPAAAAAPTHTAATAARAGGHKKKRLRVNRVSAAITAAAAAVPPPAPPPLASAALVQPFQVESERYPDEQAAAQLLGEEEQQRADNNTYDRHDGEVDGSDEAEQVGRAAEVREEGDDDNVGEGLDSSVTDTTAPAESGGAAAAAAAAAPPPPAAAELARIGALLNVESALNLRLATLTRQHGKPFRAIAVYLPETRETMNFTVTFVDIASGAQLVCTLSEVRTRYLEWISLFCSSFVALFLPTLQSPSAVLLQNAIGAARPPRPPPGSSGSSGSSGGGASLHEDPDHLFFSYAKLREVISHKKKDTALNPQLLTVTVLNAYAEEWKNFIAAPLSCAPQAFLLAAFNFQSQTRDGSGGSLLNKELLQAQLAAAADAMVLYASTSSSSQATRRRTGAVATAVAATPTGQLRSDADRWGLIFISAPARTTAGTSAIPPMQDLLTGQFVQPLSLSERALIYIIGTGTAAESFARFPLARKGKCAFSILLEDIEAQLGLTRPHRVNLTAVLTKALDQFSRITWMGLMKEEDGEPHLPQPSSAFYHLQRRRVQREIMPSFLEPVFAPGPRLMGGAAGRPAPRGGGGGGGGSTAADTPATAQASRLLEEHLRVIFNNPGRLARETALQTAMRSRVAYFMHVTSASVTAARRADNPFSSRNGMVDVSGQLWPSLGLMNPPAVLHWRAKVDARSGEMREYVDPELVLPDTLPIGPPDAPDPKDRAEGAVLIGWDLKRILLFLRGSTRLRTFLYNGGKVWCAQYAQYLLKGCNHLHLATMERTLLQCHDGPLTGALHPLAKLKLIYEMQLDVAVSARQMSSVLHRMDGLLASMEMELHGLQLAPQSQVTYFANKLRLDHERLEKVLQQKIMDFTQSMDDDVRRRINFRSPQDISTIIYGGGLCRHLGSRFVPAKPARSPATSLFPHAACHVTGTTVPEAYTQVDAVLASISSGSSSGSSGGGGGGGGGRHSGDGAAITAADVQRSLHTIEQMCRRCTMDELVQQTAVVVVICKVRIGGLLEQIAIYCPATTGPDTPELNLRVAVDDIIPVTERPDVVTVSQLKERIAAYAPLKQLLSAAPVAAALPRLAANKAASRRPQRGADGRAADTASSGASAATADLRNLLILTNTTQDKLEPLVDTGVLATIKSTVFGGCVDGVGGAREPVSLERVCFADLSKAFPPPLQATDTFESDFSELSTSQGASFSAKTTWEAQAKELVSLGGVEGAVKSIVSQCASLIGTPRDPFRSSQPTPSSALQGLHGQERASTAGMLWMVTPAQLHPLLRRFLRGKSASSGADAMERVTVLLSPYKTIDLSFFTSLQQLRFTEKKLHLFEEGCLFRAVLPECHDRVHGELCHCVTATGRLSSQSPNLQNIPREEDLRRLLVSRFGAQGTMIEADYSQLEVVVLAALCRDPRMMQELRENVDFHCLRVSLMTKEPYEDVVRKAKVDRDPQYIQLRQQAKVFSFQRQYGAGVATIATTTGLTEQEVDRLIVAEEHHYKELNKYYSLVTRCVEVGADRLLRLRTLDSSAWTPQLRRVVMLTEPMYYFVVPTGSKFDFARDRKSVPRLKNYPVQGLAGEIVQIMCGAIVREFYRKRNYGEKAFLVNTVHDCVWVDAHRSVADEVRADLARIMGHTQETIAALWPDMKLDVPFKAEIHSGPSLGELSV